MATENTPSLWKEHFSLPKQDGHKYDRGHAIVSGGPIDSTGAARLAATAALRIGAGAVTVCCDNLSLPVYASHLTAVMTKVVESTAMLSSFVAKKNSVLIGPGHGLTPRTQDYVQAILESKIHSVLDADALTAFENAPGQLTQKLHNHTIITPHEGEFSRVFPNITGSREERAHQVAQEFGCIVVLKGSETVIASPENEIVINKTAPMWLATAGSGDVLSGIITGLLAQGFPPFAAACAGAWLHSECAKKAGPFLISEDLLSEIKEMITLFYQENKIL